VLFQQASGPGLLLLGVLQALQLLLLHKQLHLGCHQQVVSLPHCQHKQQASQDAGGGKGDAARQQRLLAAAKAGDPSPPLAVLVLSYYVVWGGRRERFGWAAGLRARGHCASIRRDDEVAD
jgi:hypothetical protein